MNNSLQTTFFQFQAALEEWFTREEINECCSEALALYAHGIPVSRAASILASII